VYAFVYALLIQVLEKRTPKWDDLRTDCAPSGGRTHTGRILSLSEDVSGVPSSLLLPTIERAASETCPSLPLPIPAVSEILLAVC
jgi:hypothetical protein